MEATAVAAVICGANATWPARFVFKVLEDVEQAGKSGSVSGPKDQQPAC